MSSCEKCWVDAGGDVGLYQELVERRGRFALCTPEDQAGPGAEDCPKCGRRTLHQITGECMACHHWPQEKRELI